MAENTQIISGYIVRPNGDPFTEGVVRFTLGRSDTDEDEVIAAGKYVEFDIATDGSFAAELWPNTRGNVGGAYIVQVREAERTPFETIGRVQVQDDGPYDLAALLRADIPQAQNTFYSVLSQDEYDAFVAEMDAKVAEAKGYAESYDVAAISAAVTATGNDASATAADRVATGEDATATAADRVATGDDAAATAADRVATGQDVIAAGNSAQAASDAAAAVPDIKTFDTYDESITYGGNNSAALIFCKSPVILFKGSAVFWRLSPLEVADLFRGGEVGVWYDPSDISTLWQDTAGTVPVSAAGQSVARMDDKSGNGKHATQATASARPSYQTDGALHWLSFDGVDDRMSTAPIDMTGTSEISFFAGARGLDTSGALSTLFTTSSDTGNYRFLANVPHSGAEHFTAFGRGTTVATAAATGAAYALPNTRIMTAACDLSAGQISLSLDRVQIATSSGLGTAGAFRAAPYTIGALTSAGASPFEGNLYGLISRGKATNLEAIAVAETYLAEKSGVTL